MKYKNYRIVYDPPPIPTRIFDWQFYHRDFDGAPDADDIRCGTGATYEDCKNQIDEIEQSYNK